MKYQSIFIAALTMSVAAASPMPKGSKGGSGSKPGKGGSGGSGSSPKSSKPSPTKPELEPSVAKQTTPPPPPPQQPTSSPKPTPTPPPQEPTSSPKPTPTPTPTPTPSPTPSASSSSSIKASPSSSKASSSSSAAAASSSSSSVAGPSSSAISSSFISGSSSSSIASSSLALTSDVISSIISGVSSGSSRSSTGLTASSTVTSGLTSGLTSTGTASATSTGTHTGTETSTGTETITSMTSTTTGTATSTTLTSSVSSTPNPEYVPFSGAFPQYPVNGMAPPTEEQISSNKPNGVPDWVAPLIEKGIWNIATTGSLFGSTFNVTDGTDDGSGDDGINNGDNSTSTDDGSGDGDGDGSDDNGDGCATNGTSTTGPYYNGTSVTSSLVGTGTAGVPVPLNTGSLTPTMHRRGKGKNNGGKGGKGGKGDDLQCPTKWEDTVEHMKPKPKRDEAMFFSNAGKDTPSSFSRLNKKLVVAAAFNEAYTQKISNCPDGWEHASTAWAMVASGDVYVLMPALSAADRKNPKSWFNWPTNYKGGVSVWENYEWPYLVQNKNVCRIWRVDKSGLASAVLLAVRNGGSCAPGTLGPDPVTGAQPATTLAKRIAPKPTAPIAL